MNNKWTGLLVKNPVFQSLTPADWAELLALAEPVSVPAGHVLFDIGDIGDALYIIRSGTVVILTTDGKGREIVLATLAEGACFGEQALLPGNRRRNAKALSAEPTRLLRIGLETFLAFLQNRQELAQRLREVGLAQLRDNLARQHDIFKPLLGLLKTEPAADALTTEEFEHGEVVFREGDPGDRVFLIASGFVKFSRRENGQDIALGRLGQGHYFGEIATLNQAPRSATATADGYLKVLSLKGQVFLSLYAQSSLLREYMECLTSFYANLPAGGLMTLYRGKFMGKDSLTALHHIAEGVTLAATRVIGEPMFTVAYRQERRRTTTVSWQNPRDPAVTRELTISRNRLVGATAIGEWPDLGRVYQAISRKLPLHVWQLALFRREGELWLEREARDFRDHAVVCRCTGVTRGTLNQAVAAGCDTAAELAERTGASRVCGSCAPLLAEIVGHSDLAPAELLAVVPVTRDVKSFRFRPREGRVLPYRPGQHIRVETRIGGHWVQRAYTLTSPHGQDEYYEITVKREPQGTLSRWLHDILTEHSPLRISEPQGHFYLDTESTSPVVCLSGGIGITPALSMLRWFEAHPGPRPLHIDYSVSDPEQVVYPAELRKAEDRPQVRIDIRVTGERGRLRGADLARLAARYPGATFYICGSPAYEKAVTGHLRALPVTEERIRVEHFSPPAARPPLKGGKSLLSGSCLVLLFGLAIIGLGPPAPPSSILEQDFSWLWRDFFWQQASGYTVLALSGLGLLISARKRVRRVRRGDYAWWRLLHVVTGGLALAALAVHTGLHLGAHFDLLLMLCFLGLAILGGLTGSLVFLEHHKPNPATQRLGTWLERAHVALAWPLPALLGLHILAAYFFRGAP
jgi:ferredoxin-NADP reductase/CRP-like cAMP-binding protein